MLSTWPYSTRKHQRHMDLQSEEPFQAMASAIACFKHLDVFGFVLAYAR